METASVELVYLYVWTGDAEEARALVGSRFPGAEVKEFSHRTFRNSGIAQRIQSLYSCRGRAVVFYFRGIADSKYTQLLKCLHLLHRCRETVLSDAGGHWESIRKSTVLRLFPTFLAAALRDGATLIFWWCWLRIMIHRAAPVDTHRTEGDLDVGYLIPTPENIGSSGGAISHIRGVLGGLKKLGKTCRVFCGIPLAQDVFETEVIPPKRRRLLFWEPPALAYNFVFVRRTRESLSSLRPRFLYQRHRVLSVAGALLSRRLQVPLILEYNGSEVWISDHWDQTSFRFWIRLCEEFTIHSASRIVVVSDVLKAELLERGIPEGRIVVNPNAVDPDFFAPGRGRDKVRQELGIATGEILVGFVGTFSLWHGIEVLQQAIAKLLTEHPRCQLRFVLIGDGLLREQMRSFLKTWVATDRVMFPGTLPHDKVVEYLDAADILVSPHIPMPDGSRFFGSPTKLFEYMAMGKSIVASRLDQLAEVLEHNRTAWLVTPGSVDELADAILFLASDPERRSALGMAARRIAVERHSWSRNAALSLENL